jgi:hypothetical protein
MKEDKEVMGTQEEINWAERAEDTKNLVAEALDQAPDDEYTAMWDSLATEMATKGTKLNAVFHNSIISGVLHVFQGKYDGYDIGKVVAGEMSIAFQGLVATIVNGVVSAIGAGGDYKVWRQMLDTSWSGAMAAIKDSGLLDGMPEISAPCWLAKTARSQSTCRHTCTRLRCASG